MLIRHSVSARPLPSKDYEQQLDTIDADFLRAAVKTLAFPRHYLEEPEQNKIARDFIRGELENCGYEVSFACACDNIVATTRFDRSVPKILIGAHYDSVPKSPGADDNASAVAALLSIARALAPIRDQLPIIFVAFNREEEALLGSRLFAQYLQTEKPFKIREAHILEMIGYTDPHAKHKKPVGLPIKLPEGASFLGLIAKSKSNHLIKPLLRTAKTYLPKMPVSGLKIWFGLDKYFTVLRRSDHSPLWDIGVPAIMWTDTSEFRNPHYHKPTDTPETLDYEFLGNVTKLLLAHILLSLSPDQREVHRART
jgi:hypothetical protein